MQSWSQTTHCGGFDWAHDHHEVVIVNRSGKNCGEDFQIEHIAQVWQCWREQVAALGPGLATCVETSQGALSSRNYWKAVLLLILFHQSVAKAVANARYPAATKLHRLDVWTLADALRVDGHGWKALAKEDSVVAELRLLCRDKVALIKQAHQAH